MQLQCSYNGVAMTTENGDTALAASNRWSGARMGTRCHELI